MSFVDELKIQFPFADFRTKRIGLYKILVPMFHEDGDMYDLFIEEHPELPGKLRISDHGLTLMRLSYNFELDTPNKVETLEGIVMQNRCLLDEGTIFLDIDPTQFECGLYQFMQTVSKVSNMEIMSAETTKSHFFEYLDQFFNAYIQQFGIKRKVTPLIDQSDLTVDYEIPAKRPIYVFGVNSNNRASQVVISCLTFETRKLEFQSLIVSENIDALNKFNRKQVLNVGGKTFTDIDALKAKGPEYLARELAWLGY